MLHLPTELTSQSVFCVRLQIEQWCSGGHGPGTWAIAAPYALKLLLW